jgi:arabinose-5-phosphate isomerase
MTQDPRLARAREVLTAESQAILLVRDRLGEPFLRAVDAILACEGHVVVTGMGKAGKIAEKLSATLASTGTPSFFLHPGEALHGDMGRCARRDLLLALSNSGNTEELVRLIPLVKQVGSKLVSITGKSNSALAKESDVNLDIGEIEEACPLGLAPTASTAAMLALGDALAMVVLERRGFTRDDFAAYHPAGALGRQLLRVRERMRTGDALPLVPAGITVREALVTMHGKGRAGVAMVVDKAGVLTGIFTDGDLRRLLVERGGELLSESIDHVMVKKPKTIGPDALAAEASRVLHDHRIDQLAVVDGDGKAVGLLDVQDLLGIPIG